MAEVQNTVLEINKSNYEEADFMSRRFINAETRNRAYINVLGAELFTHYLAGNGYETEDIVSMHSISKVLEDIDIADILLPNVHLDVRTVFDEDKIFIPKSHFELDITPDIYIVLKLSKNLKEATLLGYFKPSQINKNYENSDYYFMPAKMLSSPDTLLKTLSKYNAIKDQKLEPQEFLKGRALSVALSDHNLNNAERKELYRLMLTSSMLRDSVAEFDNFEVLSNQVSAVLLERIELKEQASKAVPGIAALTTEEILKEGIEAAITEKTAEAKEVFDTITESAEAVEEIAETTAKLSDVFESAPVEEPSAHEENPKDEKPASTLEILQTEETTASDSQNDESEETSEENQAEEPQEESDIAENQILEEELTIGDIDDELSLDEDLQIADLDTLDTEEVEEQAEETAKTEDLTEEVQQEQSEEQQENIDEITQEVETVTTQQTSEQEESDISEEQEEMSLSEELTIGDIDDELSLDEDLQFADLDTLDTEEVEEQAEETAKTEDLTEEVLEEHSEEELETDIVEETSKEDEEIEITEEPQEEELLIGDIDDELSLDEDLQVADLDTLDVEKNEEQPEETVASEPEIAQVQEQPEEKDAASEEETESEETSNLEEDLVIGDIDDELTLDEDLQITDLDTLETNDVEEKTLETPKEERVAPIQTQPEQPTVTSYTPEKPIQEMSVDTLLDNAIAAIDENKPQLPKVEVPEKVSDAAIKMTSVAGGAVDELVKGLAQSQADKLNHIDYQHTSDTHTVPQTGDYMSFVGGLSDAKRQANMLAEAQGLAEKPTDLSQLTVVEQEKQEEIVHEVVDIETIETVQREEFVEDESEIVELGEIKDVDSPTKPVKNLEEIALQPIETETMELPDLNSYTINEDGTSPLDNMNWGPEEETNPDDLLDLDVAETLIGGETNIAETDFTDDLIDGSAFKTTDSLYETKQPEEITITEDKNSDEDSFELTEDFINELSSDNMPEIAEETSDNTINNSEEHVEVNNTEVEITEISQDELTGEILEDTMEAEPAEITQQETLKPEWTEDTGYEELADIEPAIPSSNEDFIVEENPETTIYNAKSNSTVISDKTFTPGEINIDINTNKIPQPEQDEDTINSLYDSNSAVATNTILNNPGRLSPQKQKSTGGLAAGLGIAGTLVVLVLLFALGFGVSKFLKGPADETPQPISEDSGNVNENYAQQPQPAGGEVVEMDNNTNALASTAGTQTTTDKTTFVEVKKLSWEVPGAVSAEPKFQQYFQSAGKSLKSALMTDLLSVSDKAYASEMRVSITFNKDGSFRDARIITASGSNQIDNIVLRTVNQTLNVLKAPHSVGSYENTTAVLKIYL